MCVAGTDSRANVRSNASTTAGSNCVPACARSSAAPPALERGSVRTVRVSASYASATARMRASSGISSPLEPTGSRGRPAARGGPGSSRAGRRTRGLRAAARRSPGACRSPATPRRRAVRRFEADVGDTPILPMSCSTPARRTRSTRSSSQTELARHQLRVAPHGVRVLAVPVSRMSSASASAITVASWSSAVRPPAGLRERARLVAVDHGAVAAEVLGGRHRAMGGARRPDRVGPVRRAPRRRS